MSTDLELFTFEQAEIRTVEIDGKRWAVASDICAALDIKNARDAVTRLDEADVATADVRSGGQMRKMYVVSEDGATDLVLDSRKPEARRFRRFLTHEVWPAIRETGSYSSTPALTEDEIVHQALAITARRVEELTARVAVLEPQAAVASKLLDADGDLSVRDAAQTLTRAGIKTGAGRLFTHLEGKPWIRRAHDGRYRVLQAAIDRGFMSVLPQSHYHPKTGELVLDPPQPRVTPKGLQRLLSDLGGAE
jgi:anti-repressor protein